VALIIGTLGHTELVALGQRLREAFRHSGFGSGVRLSVTGSYSLLLHAQASLMSTVLSSLLTSVLLMQLVLSLALRSARVGLVAMLPNVLPAFLGFLLMWVLSIPLDVGTSMTAAVALGIAVDDTLHLAHAWSPADPGQAARTSGRAVVASSLVIGAGFLAIAPSDFLPARHFALLSASAMLSALLADLLVLPPLLVALGFRRAS
jgi:predicted RND superfamily exporter protein